MISFWGFIGRKRGCSTLQRGKYSGRQVATFELLTATVGLRARSQDPPPLSYGPGLRALLRQYFLFSY